MCFPDLHYFADLRAIVQRFRELLVLLLDRFRELLDTEPGGLASEVWVDGSLLKHAF